MSAAQPMGMRQNVATPYGPIPEWYEPHSEEVLDREVYHRGTPLGFKVRDVLPSRRWAIDAQGNTLSDSEYENRYKQWYRLQLSMESQGKPITEDLNIIPIQRIEDFINKEPDHDGKLKPIGQDERPSEFRARQRYAHTGQTMEDYEKEVAEERAKREKEREREVQARQLMQLHQSGVLTDAQLAKHLEELYGVPSIAPAEKKEDPVSAPSEEETSGANRPDPPKATAGRSKKSRCGKEFPKGGVHLHERACDECKRLKVAEEAPAEA